MTAPAVVTPARPSLIDRLLDRIFAVPGERRGGDGMLEDTACDLRAGLEAMASSPMAPPITEYAQSILARQYGGGRG